VRGFVQETLRSEAFLGAEVAIRRAQEGLEVYGLNERKNYAEVLRRAKPAPPVLVQRLDHLDTFYYVVPVREGERTTPLAIAVDALTGAYLQSAINAQAGQSVFTPVEREVALKSIAGRVLELPGRLGRLRIRPDALCHYPHFVWKPCRESLSPFYPFYMFTVGSHRIFVRSDGAIFTELHDTEHGI
jgi:hypothetical protein